LILVVVPGFFPIGTFNPVRALMAVLLPAFGLPVKIMYSSSKAVDRI